LQIANIVYGERMGEAFGPYRVYEQLGVGGMATVHRAEIDVRGTKQVVALKRLLPDLARDTSYVRRFVDEARLGQRLRHVNIARTYDVGRFEGTHYIALEYIQGPTVLQVLQHAMDTQPTPIFISLHLVTQVARALAYAHGLREQDGRSLRLVHRDIAPSNIIVSGTGATKLIDFGVAKTTAAHTRTAVGSVIGKLRYIAPEYLSGRFDARVDLFSLGVVAYELLTSRPLFDVDDLRTAEELRERDIAPPSTLNPCVPAELDAIIMTALQRDPGQRWQNAFALYTALSTFEQDSGLAVHDREVAAWIERELPDAPRVEPELAPVRTSEFEIDIDRAFARMHN
jgi:serine/threonine protein kinase